ncbi:MAG: type II toxin-antitoxin system RelE/ParE family toxin [Patescibacteria group bacterium]
MHGNRILYHPLVVKRDIPNLGNSAATKIRRAIEAKLVERPEIYGSPLRGTLKKYWKLRVGDYRVVYELVRGEVRILVIAHRRHVYTMADERDKYRRSQSAKLVL